MYTSPLLCEHPTQSILGLSTSLLNLYYVFMFIPKLYTIFFQIIFGFIKTEPLSMQQSTPVTFQHTLYFKTYLCWCVTLIHFN